jgi:hypothetical protein
MKAFRRMSFPRAVILFCTLGSLALGTLVYLRSRRLSEVEAELRRVPEIIKEMHTDAYRLEDLRRSASAEKFKAQSEPETYIRAIAVDGKINMGQIDISKQTKSPAKGIEDSIYKITAQTKTQRYTRGQIGNFLYRLEADSRRVRVTRIKLTPYEKVAPGEIGKDQWVFEAELTTRTKIDGAPAPADQG